MTRTRRLLANIVAASVAVSAIGTLIYAQTAPVAPPPPVAPTSQNAEATAKALVEKAKDLFQADKILDAKATNDAALKLLPDYLPAKVLDARIKMRISEMAGNNTTNPANTTQQPAHTGGEETGVHEKLTNAQINRMRAYETTADDKTLAGTVDQQTLNDFWKEVIVADPKGHSIEPKDKEAFLTGGFAEQVRMFKESGRNDFIDKLKITGDPVAMKAFKEINTWVVNSCTYQPGCHAVDNSSEKFRIYTKGGETPANLYTNFYIMSHITYGNNDLIDRQRPESSVLAQFGLPVKEATVSHPGTKKIPQRFTSLKDPAYLKLVNALEALRVLGNPPNYGFGAAATTAPATEPAK